METDDDLCAHPVHLRHLVCITNNHLTVHYIHPNRIVPFKLSSPKQICADASRFWFQDHGEPLLFMCVPVRVWLCLVLTICSWCCIVALTERMRQCQHNLCFALALRCCEANLSCSCDVDIVRMESAMTTNCFRAMAPTCTSAITSLAVCMCYRCCILLRLVAAPIFLTSP
jgi:hypothetical protein